MQLKIHSKPTNRDLKIVLRCLRLGPSPPLRAAKGKKHMYYESLNWGAQVCTQKSTFLPYRVKKHHSTLEMDTFKVMLLLSYLASLDNKPRT